MARGLSGDYPVTQSSTGGIDFAKLMEEYSTKFETAKAENIKRYDQGLAIYDEIINRYRPGGSFGQAALGELASQKERYIGKGTQDLVSSGLFGTSVKAGMGGTFEKEIGAPTRLKLEDLMMSRLSDAQMGKVGFMENRTDAYPDMSQMSDLMNQAAQYQPSNTRIVGSGSMDSGVSYSPGTPSSGFLAGGTGGGGAGFSSGSKAGIADYSNVNAEQLASAQKPQTRYDPQALTNTPTTQTTVPSSVTGGAITPQELMKLPTYAAYKAAAEGAGKAAGPEKEWAAVRRQLGY